MNQKKQQTMRVNNITADDIRGLSENMSVLFSALHPNGINYDQLEQLAKDSTYYKIIYDHFKKRGA